MESYTEAMDTLFTKVALLRELPRLYKYDIVSRETYEEKIEETLKAIEEMTHEVHKLKYRLSLEDSNV